MTQSHHFVGIFIHWKFCQALEQMTREMEMVESPTLEVFKRWVDVALRDVV